MKRSADPSHFRRDDDIAPRPAPRLVVLQPTSMCNLNCRYCYVPERQTKGVLDDVTFEKILDFVFACEFPRKKLDVLWHAGEPLIAGIGFFRNAIDMMARRQPPGLDIRHIIQTNGTLINVEWCKLFKEHSVQIGISLDGPQAVHDLARRSWNGTGSHRQAMQGVEILRAAGIEPAALCVVTRASMSQPDAIYDFFKSNDFSFVGFNIEGIEGDNLCSTLETVDFDEIRRGYQKFIKRLWCRSEADCFSMMIREIRQLVVGIAAYQNDKNFQAIPDETVPFRILSFGKNGEIGSFSPELLSTKSEDYKDFILGNVACDTPQTVLESMRFKKLDRDIRRAVGLCKDQCEHFALCGGGFFSNRILENKSLLSTETLTCRLNKKTVIDTLVEELMQESARLNRSDTPLKPNAIYG